MSRILQQDITITQSNGRGKGGKSYYFIRPLAKCDNRSRKVGGFNYQEIQPKIDKVIAKWYFPIVILYQVEDMVIGSNSKENALKEYWRVCDPNDIGVTKIVEVK